MVIEAKERCSCCKREVKCIVALDKRSNIVSLCDACIKDHWEPNERCNGFTQVRKCFFAEVKS